MGGHLSNDSHSVTVITAVLSNFFVLFLMIIIEGSTHDISIKLYEVAVSEGLKDRLKGQVIGSGQSHGTGHFDILEVASSKGLAIFKESQDRLKDQVIGSGQSHGTGHFQRVSRQAERSSYREWPVPRDWPFTEGLETG